MAYSADVVRRARQTLAQNKEDKQSKYRQALVRAYAQVPRLKEIDLALRQSMTVAAQTVFSQGGDATQVMEQAKKDNLALQAERQKLVAEHFAPGYLDDSPNCPHCGDNGYIGTNMCRCLELLCRTEQKKEIAQLTAGQERFENFRLDYYSQIPDRKYGASPRDVMTLTLKNSRIYAETFGENAGNLLFTGNTGLGKTFLSACIANAVTDKGYSVAYESAPQMFTKLEKNKFNPNEENQQQVDKIFQCDLLIVDDLGTEMPSAFVTAALYNLLNERLLAGKSMIISTNLLNDEIAKRYTMQIASRLRGEFKGMTFIGDDIRVLNIPLLIQQGDCFCY